jgi:hypothetical protein
MKLKSLEIKTQIEKTNSRILELQPQLTDQTAAFETAQRGFVMGKVTLDAFHTEQSKMLLVKTTIVSLETGAQQLEIELQSALENEARQSVIAQMKAVANDAKKGFDAFVARRAELDTAARRAIDALENFRGAQNTFTKQFRQLAPNVEDPNRINKHSRAEHEAALIELEQSGISKETLDFISRRSLADLPPLEFGGRLVTVAEEIVNLKNHHAHQAQRDKIRDAQMQVIAVENQKKADAREAADQERREELKAEKVRLEVERLERNAAKAEAEAASPATKKAAVFQSM